MEYKIFKQKNSGINLDFIETLKKQFSLSYTSSLILNKKGINTFLEAEKFLYPKIEDLYSPFLFNDISPALDLIEGAIINDKKILVFGDYDCDGVTSCVIMHKVLTKMNIDTNIMIPSRYTNGYGLGQESIEEILKIKPDILITVDNGITSKKEIDILLENGIKVIVTDHHNPPNDIPKVPILNPKVEDEKYPFKELCGAGVSLKFVMGMIEKFNIKMDMEEIITFAMIGTIADIVSLRDENRSIVHLGLEYMKGTKNLGLKKLVELSGLKLSNINSGNIGFQIAPRINAIGRLSDANVAVKLFLSEEEEEVEKLANLLEEANLQRKDIENDIIKKSEIYIEKNDLLKEEILFILGEDFSEGVMGVAAGKICEKYNRPVIIMSKNKEILKASCRSINGFDIFDCLDTSRDLFVKFGGHKAAAGFSIKEENLDKLIKNSMEYGKKNNLARLLHKKVIYDCPCVISSLSIKTASEIEKLAPFGIGNSRPVLFLEGVKIKNARTIGKDNSHLKLNVLYNGSYYDGIGFSLGYLLEEYDFEKNNFDIAFSLSINNYGNNLSIQLEIKNIDYSVDLLNEYYKSLYNHFSYNLDISEDFTLKSKDILKNENIESVLDKGLDKTFIIYSKDCFLRSVKYLNYKKIPYHISYNHLEYQEGVVNLFINPISKGKSKEVIVIDNPTFNDLEKEIYENSGYKFLNFNRQIIHVKYTREFFLYLYKSFKLVEMTSNNIYEFMNNIKGKSDIEINYFTFMLGLDMLRDMEILSYNIEEDDFYLNFNKINGQKDINTLRIMVKLQCIN